MQTKFKYGDKVYITEGFYRGKEGVLTNCWVANKNSWFKLEYAEYTIKIKGIKDDYITVREEEICLKQGKGSFRSDL